jgi:hypothetical protein
LASVITFSNFQRFFQSKDYFRRSLRALNLHKKIEYTASTAPAQLGKAKVSGYRKPAARLRLLFGIGFFFEHLTASTLGGTNDWMRGDGLAVASMSVKARSMPGKTS